MDFPEFESISQKVLPVAVLTGLVADWIRLRMSHRSEEKKHIARAIADLLELRHAVLGIRRVIKMAPEIFPEEIRDQIPADFWHQFDFVQLFPVDEKLPERYRKAVDEIASYRPVLAFQLRGKESYFDFRKVISKYFNQGPPGFSTFANNINELLDAEFIPLIEETLQQIAKSHGIPMRVRIWFALRKRDTNVDALAGQIKGMFHEQIRAVIAAEKNEAALAAQDQTPVIAN